MTAYVYFPAMGIGGDGGYASYPVEAHSFNVFYLQNIQQVTMYWEIFMYSEHSTMRQARH